MKVKAKSPKAKFGLPVVFVLCSLFFFAGLFTFTLLSHVSFPQFLSGPRSVSRTLQSEDGEDHGPMPQGETGDSFIQSIPFQVLSWKPRALYFPRFATAEQCESVIEMAKTKLRPSALALRKGETTESTKGTRTSSGTFISASEDETGILEIIEEKIARATMLPRTHGEAFNVLRYEIGQKYDSHYDAFNPSEYGQQKSQRFASFLLYLSDVEEGGETMFPFEVMPRQGDGLLFYSVLPNGTIDQTSLHGSCPVIKGEKWVATKWIRNQEDLE